MGQGGTPGGWGTGGYGPPPAPGGYGPPPGPQSFGRPGPMLVATPLGGMVPACHYCGGQTHVHSKISTAGWLVFFGLLVFCFPLCWIGLTMKDTGRRCLHCLAMQGSMG